MKGKYFLDTNILVYTFDPSDRKKRDTARDLVNGALADNQGLISWQVVQEFLNVARRKFATPLSPEDCRLYLRQVLAPLCEVFPSIDLYQRALEIHERENFSYYDSLIVAAADEAGCRTLFTEDLREGSLASGLAIRNPFRSA